MTAYDELIQDARRQLAPAQDRRLQPLDGPPVQLSVRMPAGLRQAAVAVAQRHGETLAAFVTELVERAVRADRDPLAGLAADMASATRAELAAALADGSYASAAAEVDAAEATST